MRRANKADLILGIQWGDEGKGRVVDYYAGEYEIVARFGGGDNAGHTIVVGNQTLALRIVPSGVLGGCELFIGGGAVIALDGLHAEIDALAKLGIDVSRIKVSDRAHVVFPHHAARDKQQEADRGEGALGTTGRGIGPAYADRVSRQGLTIGELLGAGGEERLRSRHDFVQRQLAAARAIAPHVVDGAEYIHAALDRGARILLEGAQGSLLDIGYGTYPFVTSSHTIAGAACTGLGIGPGTIGRILGVAKAYCTRVGAGPFPSELFDENGEWLQEHGREYGTVTGRRRRCGWFDAVAGCYAARLNGLAAIVLTKLDVLSGLSRVGVVSEYRVAGRPVPFGRAMEAELEVQTEYFEGWDEPLGEVRKIRALPSAAKRYVKAIGELLGVPIDAVSVGPERSQLAT